MFQKLGMPSRRLLLSATQFIFVSHRCSRCRSCKVAHGGKPCSLQHTACASWPGRIPRIYTLTNVFGYIKYIRHPDQNERKIKSLSLHALPMLCCRSQRAKLTDSLSLEKAGRSQFVTHQSLSSGSTLTISI